MSAKITFKALTPDRWNDFETLFGAKGACGGCWCMAWRRLNKEFQTGKGDGNKKAMKKIVKAGEEPGLLAYDGAKPIGWISIAPRESFPRLEKTRTLKRIDDLPVWSISCLFVHKDYRNSGLSVSLIKESLKFARKKGCLVIESYPYEIKGGKEQPPPFIWTGVVPAYKKAGFKIVSQQSKARPMMRFYHEK